MSVPYQSEALAFLAVFLVHQLAWAGGNCGTCKRGVELNCLGTQELNAVCKNDVEFRFNSAGCAKSCRVYLPLSKCKSVGFISGLQSDRRSFTLPKPYQTFFEEESRETQTKTLDFYYAKCLLEHEVGHACDPLLNWGFYNSACIEELGNSYSGRCFNKYILKDCSDPLRRNDQVCASLCRELVRENAAEISASCLCQRSLRESTRNLRVPQDCEACFKKCTARGVTPSSASSFPFPVPKLAGYPEVCTAYLQQEVTFPGIPLTLVTIETVHSVECKMYATTPGGINPRHCCRGHEKPPVIPMPGDEAEVGERDSYPSFDL